MVFNRIRLWKKANRGRNLVARRCASSRAGRVDFCIRVDIRSTKPIVAAIQREKLCVRRIEDARSRSPVVTYRMNDFWLAVLRFAMRRAQQRRWFDEVSFAARMESESMSGNERMERDLQLCAGPASSNSFSQDLLTRYLQQTGAAIVMREVASEWSAVARIEQVVMPFGCASSCQACLDTLRRLPGGKRVLNGESFQCIVSFRRGRRTLRGFPIAPAKAPNRRQQSFSSTSFQIPITNP